MTPFELLKLASATWLIAYMVTKTSGPLAIFERLREYKGGRWHGRKRVPSQVSITGTSDDIQADWKWEYVHDGLLDCIICLSIWIALTLVLIGSNVVTDAFAVAGVALFLHSYTGWRINM